MEEFYKDEQYEVGDEVLHNGAVYIVEHIYDDTSAETLLCGHHVGYNISGDRCTNCGAECFKEQDENGVNVCVDWGEGIESLERVLVDYDLVN